MFGALYVVGDDWFDTVCIGNVPSESKTNCVKQFRFLAVTDIAPNLTPMDGMIGLGPDDPSNGPSYVASLFNSGLIGRKMFGLIFGNADNSQITLGGWDESKFKSSDDPINFFPQTNSSRWEIELRDAKMGNNSFWVSCKKAVIDTFYRTVTLPMAEYQKFQTNMLSMTKAASCNSKTLQCQFSGKCSRYANTLPSFRLQFGSLKTFSMNPNDYLEDR